MTNPFIPTEKLTAWLSRLVQIPSVNNRHAGRRAGAPGEGRIAAELADWFSQWGGQVHMEEVHPGRPNVYAIWQGRSDRWAAIDVHTDTVGVEHMVGDPFDGRIADGRVYGRGAVDTKATLGVTLALLEAMHQQGITQEPNLLIAATVDEEDGAQTAPIFADWIRRQQIPLSELLVAEPTLCHPVYGHKGGVVLEFTVKGVASHSAKPHLGKNAIYAAARVIAALEAEHQRLQTLPAETELGAATINVALIQGGTGSNVVPDECRFTAGWRSVPGETGDQIVAHLKQLAETHSPLPITAETLLGIEPFLQSPDTPWVRRLSEWSGYEPMVAPYGTNAWAYGDLPGECIVLGPGSIDQAHGDVEWVEISELEKLAQIFVRWWGIA